MDGGSTDRTIEIIKKYTSQIAYWESCPDQGQSHAINKGFLRAKGSILAWLNSDDQYMPDSVETAVKTLSNKPNIDIVYGDILIISECGEPLNLIKSIPFHYKTLRHSTCLIPQPTSFFRRSVIDKVGLLDTSLHYQMDVEFFIRMGSFGLKFANIRKVLALYRIHADAKNVSQYGSKVQVANKNIKERYLQNRLRRKAISDSYLRRMEHLYRFRSYIVRTLTRGFVVPFQTKRSLKSISK